MADGQAPQNELTFYGRLLRYLLNHHIFATVVFGGVCVVALAEFQEAAHQLTSIFDSNGHFEVIVKQFSYQLSPQSEGLNIQASVIFVNQGKQDAGIVDAQIVFSDCPDFETSLSQRGGLGSLTIKSQEQTIESLEGFISRNDVFEILGFDSETGMLVEQRDGSCRERSKPWPKKAGFGVADRLLHVGIAFEPIDPEKPRAWVLYTGAEIALDRRGNAGGFRFEAKTVKLMQ